MSDWRERLHDLLHRSRDDDELRAKLKDDPKGTLAAADIAVPDTVDVVVVEDTPEVAHLVLPARATAIEMEVEVAEDEMGQVAGAEWGAYGDGQNMMGSGGMQMGLGQGAFQGGSGPGPAV